VLLAPLSEVIAFLAPPLCWGCRAPVRSGEPLCPPCRRGLRWLPRHAETLEGVRMWAPVAYQGAARELVRALKFRSAQAVAAAMAAPIAAGAPADLLRGATLVPVPLPPDRTRRRGYNQAAVLARAVAYRTGVPICECLARTRSRGTQVGRGRAQRLEAVAGSVRLCGEPPPRPLLVDDVITTGATVAACAAVLGGADAVSYARTPGR
jgi:ComF family protein